MTTKGFLYHDTTVVSPIYSEQWHVYPPAYDIVDNYPHPRDEVIDVKDPRDFPYGQYTSRLNLIPRQEYQTRLFCNGRSDAEGYIYDLFTINDISFRENMTRILKQKLRQRYRHNGYDTFSPYTSNFTPEIENFYNINK